MPKRMTEDAASRPAAHPARPQRTAQVHHSDAAEPAPALGPHGAIDARSLTPALLLALQRTIGNQAVQRVIQRARVEGAALMVSAHAGGGAQTANAPGAGLGRHTLQRVTAKPSARRLSGKWLLVKKIEKGVRNSDAAAVKAQSLALYNQDASFYMNFLTYKMSKHADGSAQHKLYIEATPTATALFKKAIELRNAVLVEALVSPIRFS